MYTLYTYLNTHTRARACSPRFIHIFIGMYTGENQPARFARERRWAPAALPGTRVAPPAPLTVPALVLAEPVLAAQQVEGRVQVHVDLVYAIADRLQRHPPVRGLRRLLAPRRPPGAGCDHQQQQQRGQPSRGHAEPAKQPPSPPPPGRPGPRSPPPQPPWSSGPARAPGRGEERPRPPAPWQRRGAVLVACAVSPPPSPLCRVPCAVRGLPNRGSDNDLPWHLGAG